MARPLDIAIVGMGGVFPGALSLDQFWNNILLRHDAAKDATPGRWAVDPSRVFAPTVAYDRVYSRRACFVEDMPGAVPAGIELDAKVFRGLDPLYQFVLRAGSQAYEDRAVHSISRQRIGVILAAIALPTDGASRWAAEETDGPACHSKHPSTARHRSGSPERNLQTAAAISSRVTSLPASLLARTLRLGAGSFTLDAACASSLYAIKLACDELRDGRVDAMLAGGVSRPDSLYTQMGFSQLRALSPSGRCAPFDERADGLVVGEGAGMFLLKRLEDARRDGDSVLAVIRGIGLSNDIGGGLLAPDSEGQLRAMKAAYQQAGWFPHDVQLIECHGTGTPLGDAAELRAMRSLWGESDWRAADCAIGSVKSNIGHLLTAAGAAGLAKVLLAMQRRTLPPSANFERASTSMPLAGGPFRVQTAAETWKVSASGTLRAAVSAFGFGGINAHLLLESDFVVKQSATAAESRDNRPVALRPSSELGGPGPRFHDDGLAKADGMQISGVKSGAPVAIVGMAALFGAARSLAEFESLIFSSRPESGVGATVDAAERPCGLFVGTRSTASTQLDSLEIAIGRFRVPPAELPDILPQQLLLLNVAADAMIDAGLPLRQRRPKAGVLTGMSFDFEATNYHLRWRRITDASRDEYDARSGPDSTGVPPLNPTRTVGALGNIIASRVAREFEFGGPSFALSSEECSGLDALTVAMRALSDGALDLAIVSAVDLSADPRECSSRAALRQAWSGPDCPASILPVHPVGDGAAAIVLKRLDDALRDGDRIYAVIREPPIRNADFTSAISRPVDLIEYCSGMSASDAGGLPSISIGDAALTTLPALHGVAEHVGHVGAAAGLASLVTAALCLKNRLFPAARAPSPVQSSDESGSMNVPCPPAYWFRNREEGPRRAAVCVSSIDHQRASVLLEESDTLATLQTAQRKATNSRRDACARFKAAPRLFSIEADSPALMLHLLDDLETAASGIDSVAAIFADWQSRRSARPRAALAATIIADGRRDLIEAIRRLRGALQDRPDEAFHDADVHFTPSPMGGNARIAFVFPGAGNAYPGMGDELMLQYPDVLDALDAESRRLADQFMPRGFAPQRSDGSDARFANADRRNHEDMPRAIFRQLSYCLFMHDLLRRFGVAPHAVIGYSLGESAALIATRAWRDRDELLDRLARSSLFRSDLAAPYDALRRSWDIPSDRPIDWHVVLVPRGPEAVRAAISAAAAKYVRLLIVNTPRECVLGGLREDVYRVVQALHCRAVPLEGVCAVHCDAAESVRGPYRELHLLDTTPPAGVTFYSGHRAAAYAVTRDSAADAITSHALHGFDFAATIERAYADGIRVFVETGPRASCTRMIRRILDGRPYLAYSADDGLEAPTRRLLNLLAALIAHRVPVDLTTLAADRSSRAVADSATSGRTITIPVRPRCAIDKQNSVPPAAAKSPLAATDESLGEFESPRDRSDVSGANRDPPATPVMASFAYDRVIDDLPHDTQPAYSDSHLPDAESSTEFESPVVEQSSADGLAAAVSDLVSLGADAHAAYLQFAQTASLSLSRLIEYQRSLAQRLGGSKARQFALPNHPTTVAPQSLESKPPPRPECDCQIQRCNSPSSSALSVSHATSVPRPLFDRAACVEFARGRIGPVLGSDFAAIDDHPTRVRLPDEPLMLCDRILSVEGQPQSLTHGRLVTEHDVRPGAWYLDCGRAPVCISVEAGQADLFLSAWLGIDFVTRGVRMYRLLDATVEFHRELPRPGETLRYEIEIERFIRQGDTWLFAFNFKGTIDGRPMLTMTGGRAGFFTEEEIRNGPGLVLRDEESHPKKWQRPEKWSVLIRDSVPFRIGELLPVARESLADASIDAIRAGDLAACFGPMFDGLPLRAPLRIPGGRMRLIDRVLELDPTGGRFGNGRIRAEADVKPDDWFLTCHFVDDHTMPGTLMYECCVHTLRVLLLRAGWVGEQTAANGDPVCYQPIPGIPAKLRCRGPVTPATRDVIYQVDVKELGYARFSPGSPLEPFVVADAVMFADGKRIVSFTDMSLRITGLSRDGVERLWKRDKVAEKPRNVVVEPTVLVKKPEQFKDAAQSNIQFSESPMALIGDAPPPIARKPAVFDADRILAFATGKPSAAFGEPYRIFDEHRRIARLPGPPFQFLDRITEIHAAAWQLTPGGWIESQYDVPPDAWYFAANRQPEMPYSVILEAALQPCGWLAAYLGSALHGGDQDLSFRNLGGTATLYEVIAPDSGTLTCRTRITDVSKAGGMIIEKFDTQLYRAGRLIYDCKTIFGFFSAAALARQVGIRDAAQRRYIPTSEEESRGNRWKLPDDRPHTPDEAARAAQRALRAGSSRRGTRSESKTRNRLLRVDSQSLVHNGESAVVPARAFRMIDEIDLYLPSGGPHGLGYIRGATRVDPSAWFFKAHFHQDPVWPGSLGLESFIQILKVFAARRFGPEPRSASPGGLVSPSNSISLSREVASRSHSRTTHSKLHSSRSRLHSRASVKPAPLAFEPIELHRPHTWAYRGQIIPANQRVHVEAAITHLDHATLTVRASGFLFADGVPIYEISDFGIRLTQTA